MYPPPGTNLGFRPPQAPQSGFINIAQQGQGNVGFLPQQPQVINLQQGSMGMGMGGMGGQLAGNSMGMGLVHPFLQAAQRLQQIPPKVTLYVEGVPNDATEREVYHLFRPFPGFISLRLRGAGNRMVSHLVNSHPLPATEQSSVSIRRASPPREAIQATGHHASSQPPAVSAKTTSRLPVSPHGANSGSAVLRCVFVAPTGAALLR